MASHQASTKASNKIMRISNKEELDKMVLAGEVSPERVGRGISREGLRGLPTDQLNLNQGKQKIPLPN